MNTSTSGLKDARDLFEKGSLDEALNAIETYLACSPNNQSALQLKIRILNRLGLKSQAVSLGKLALEQFPLDIVVLREMRALGSPVPVSLETALTTLSSLGNRPSRFVQVIHYLNEGEFFNDAIEIAHTALAQFASEELSELDRKTQRNILIAVATSHEGKRDYEAALKIYESLNKNHTGKIQFGVNMARCLHRLGRFCEAEAAIRKARPEFDRFSGLAFEILLSNGKIQEAHGLYRRRPISDAVRGQFKKTPRAGDLRIVSGDYSEKSTLIFAEGGPGDELRLATLYHELPQYFGDLVVTCDPRLQTLLSRRFPDIHFLPTPRIRKEFEKDMSDRQSIEDARLATDFSDRAYEVGKSSDIVISTLDLLAEMRTKRSSFVPFSPFLPQIKRRREWSVRMRPDRLNVGIAWRSLLQSHARNVHYFSPEDFSALSPLQDLVTLWSLQPNASLEELEAIRSFLPIQVPEGLDLVDDFEGQLGLLSSLDIIVSPFTTTGELAATSGVPTVLVSLDNTTIWRRGEDGTDVWSKSTKIARGSSTVGRRGLLKEVADIIKAKFFNAEELGG